MRLVRLALAVCAATLATEVPAHAAVWQVGLDSCYQHGTFAEKWVRSGVASVACSFSYQGNKAYPPQHESGSVSFPAGRLAAVGNGGDNGHYMAAIGSDVLHLQGAWSGQIPVKLTLRLRGSIAGMVTDSDEALLGLVEAGTNSAYENTAEFGAGIASGILQEDDAGGGNTGIYAIKLEQPLSAHADVLLSVTTMVDASSPTLYVQTEIVSWGGSDSANNVETAVTHGTIGITLPAGITYVSDSGQLLGH